MKPKFGNKDGLRSVVANRPWEAIQVDLVDFTSFRSKHKSVTYSYVLAILDVFSRFLMLRPLVKKESKEIAPHLMSIFDTFGNPSRVQTDKGSEFKGNQFQTGIY